MLVRRVSDDGRRVLSTDTDTGRAWLTEEKSAAEVAELLATSMWRALPPEEASVFPILGARPRLPLRATRVLR